MKIEDIINKLSSTGYFVFESTTNLNFDIDVVLAESNINEFVRFCEMTNTKIVFYCPKYIELDDYYINEEAFREKAKDTIEHKIRRLFLSTNTKLSADDFCDVFEEPIDEIRRHNVEVSEKIYEPQIPEIDFCFVYALYNGIRVGIILLGNYMADIKTASELEESLHDELLEIVENRLNNYTISENDYLEELERAAEEEKRCKIEKQKTALDEMKKALLSDSSLGEHAANRLLRHAYAKELAEAYSERFKIKITINDTEALINKIYMSKT